MRHFLSTLLLALAAAAFANDFRGLPWGSTREQIRAAETWELVEERQDGLLYQGTIAGLNALVYYFILPETNQLAAARYVIVDNYHPFNDSGYTIEDFRNLASLLEQKYDRPSERGTHAATWQLDDTKIVLRRQFSRSDSFNTIDYRSEELGDEWDAWTRSQNPF